jgi:2-polyprenyl-3-methyl-5-hydroxy-6-metoxy-1,4-benzoquinol methylase
MPAHSLSSLELPREFGEPRRLPWRLSRRYPFPYHFHYVFFKLLLDPVYRAAASELTSSLPLLDIGCGPGLLACFLRVGGFSAAIHGIDYDARKVAVASRVMRGMPNTSFAVADVRDQLPAHSGHVTILDILQYFTPPQQKALLEAAAARVTRGGKLIVRSCLRESNWRFRLTRASDSFARITFWMPRSIAYPARETLFEILESTGLRGNCRRLSGRLPFNNFLFVFQRE